MNINYRQVIIIGGILLFFELLSYVFKKFSPENGNTKTGFPLALSVNTEDLLVGDWAYTKSTTNGGQTLIVENQNLEYHKDKSCTFSTVTQVITLENKYLQPYGYCYYGKWHVENNLLIAEWLKSPFSNGGIVKDTVIFYNEDELNFVNGQNVTKWNRISNTKHYNIENAPK